MCYYEVNPTCDVKKLTRFIHWGRKSSSQQSMEERSKAAPQGQELYLEDREMSSLPRLGKSCDSHERDHRHLSFCKSLLRGRSSMVKKPLGTV